VASEVTVAVPRAAEVRGDSLSVVRRVGYVVLGLKLAAFGCWSVILYRHFALTPDFAQYQQAWYLMGAALLG
jgi:hypothetical protein